MTNSQEGSKGQQVNNHVKSEYQKDVNRFPSITPSSQKDDENLHNESNQVAPPQQLQGSLVHWERFLHVRSIKVMLVEDDDCTRQIVTALLRNCNYEVIQAANGIQAWKILQNLSNHIDIVLTEVVMPCLSGIGLLCKIMSHKTRKNIPVIMMSSHDSMGLVFKCLSKGAVDFLVKPIRKNELKILWQHVWRRCHSSSGSGSESGTHAQKSVTSKGNLRYDNNSSKDGDDDNESDDGSGTQSTWTKTPSNQISELPDSTCGIVTLPLIHNKENAKEIMENGKTENNNGVETGEVGIKRARSSINDVAQVENGCNILRHSELSAFTRSVVSKGSIVIFQDVTNKDICYRYKTSSNAMKRTASCTQPDNIVKKESKRDVKSDGYLIQQPKADDMTPGNVVHHIHHHHHVHHYHDIEPDDQLPNHDDGNDDDDGFGLKQLAADAPCGSSNIMGRREGEINRNLENYSLNKSGSGSKHGSNVANGNNADVAKIESDVGLGEGSKIDVARRKAALIKFRQKRELRCFQKKVRYQNRKRLADQRPRVRGQFVKGTSSTNGADV
ncbi:hypothetical protein LXL04_012645 [Taraxacum kok-saghyz]